MTNPVLKKLSRPNLTHKRIAGLLEKHIGPNNIEVQCKDAYNALSRIKDSGANSLSKIVAKFFMNPHEDCYCRVIRNVIAVLRNATKNEK